jgi:putative transposase
VCVDLLQDIVKRGVDPQQMLLFVIDGSKFLRSAINQIFGDRHPVQRFRNHKIKNVMDHLPDKLKDQIKAVMKASWKLNAKEGMEEMFTLNHLGLPPTLTRCLATTNIIESPNGGVRRRTGRVSRWKNGNMVLCWAASAFFIYREKLQEGWIQRPLDFRSNLRTINSHTY